MVMANSLPKKMKPTTSSTMFAAEEKADADMGVSFATSAAVPVPPPLHPAVPEPGQVVMLLKNWLC